MQAPRSVYVAFEAFPRAKGASTHIAVMVRALARFRGPSLLLCCGYGDMPAVQREGDILIRRHKTCHPNMLHRAVEFDAFVRRTLEILPSPPELCVFRDPWGGMPLLQAEPTAAAVFEVNGLPGWELPYSYSHFPRNAALKAKIDDIEQFCLDRAAAILTVSPVTRKALATRGVAADRIHVVPNAAGEPFFQTPGDRLPIPALAEGRWFGYLGSLHAWQGVEVLLAAWARIAADWPAVRLLLVHNNSRIPLKHVRKFIRRRGLEDRVLLHGPLVPDDLAAVLPRLEFTCAPLLETARNTFQGCCPLKIVESMAAGVPVVASNLQVTRDLIASESDGLLVPPSGCRDWALALHRMLRDRGLSLRLGGAAARTARAHYCEEKAYGKLRMVFTAAIERAGAKSAGATALSGVT